MIDAFAIVNSSNGRYHVPGMEDHRPIGAFSFLGRYRIIDFPISNLSNSNIDHIQVYVSQNPRSLAEHVGSGKNYDINNKRGKLQLLFNQDSKVNEIYNTDIAAYMANIQYIERAYQPYVIITAGNMVFRQDYQELLEEHVASGADISLLYHKVDNAKEHYRVSAVLELNRQKGVRSIHRNDLAKDDRNIFMDTYVMSRNLLAKLVREAASKSSIYNLSDIINIDMEQLDVRGIQHKEKYFASVYDFRSYFEANLELLNPERASELFSSEWPFYTATTDAPPAHYFKGAKVVNSMVANGSLIEGTVENSILGRDVQVKKGAVVKNCVILGHTVVGEGVHLENQVMDKWAMVLHAKEIVAPPENPGYIRRNDVV